MKVGQASSLSNFIEFVLRFAGLQNVHRLEACATFHARTDYFSSLLLVFVSSIFVSNISIASAALKSPRQRRNLQTAL